jgi:hypothetical protein
LGWLMDRVVGRSPGSPPTGRSWCWPMLILGTSSLKNYFNRRMDAGRVQRSHRSASSGGPLFVIAVTSQWKNRGREPSRPYPSSALIGPHLVTKLGLSWQRLPATSGYPRRSQAVSSATK